jgi:hypothetical protein
MGEERQVSASRDKELGLWTSTALVVGNMIGAGIFLLPATHAATIGPVYQNNRDIHQSVLKFLNSSATVRQRTGHTDIILRAPNQKQEKAALQHLCETLTAMEKTSSLFPGNLVYHVQSPCYFLSITHESTQSTHDYL